MQPQRWPPCQRLITGHLGCWFSVNSLSLSPLCRIVKFHSYCHPASATPQAKFHSQMTLIFFKNMYWGKKINKISPVAGYNNKCSLILTLSYCCIWPIHPFIYYKCSCSNYGPRGTTVWNAPISQCLLHSNAPVRAISHHRPLSSKVL